MFQDSKQFNVDITKSDNSIDRDFYPIYMCLRNSNKKSSSLRRNHRLQKRLVRKSGKPFLYRKTFQEHLYRYFLDLSNTLINSHWNCILLTLSLVFLITWLTFACFWMIISLDDPGKNGRNATETCLSGIYGFAGYFLFSIETQSTIGYGNRYINHYCPEAVFLLCAQVAVGVCICGYIICIVYLKMVRPNQLHSVNCFSKYAAICQRDGMLCFVFRIRDCDSHRYESLTNVSAYLVQKQKDQICLRSIKLEPPGILIWPIEVVHKINETSPFWDLSAKDLIIKRFEIIVLMEGTSLSTSLLSRTTTSYLNKEILWGHSFKSCIKYCKRKESYIVEENLFNATVEQIIPLCSAKRLNEVYFETLNSFSVSDTNTSSPIFSEKNSSETSTDVLVHSYAERKVIRDRNEQIQEDSYSSEDESALFIIENKTDKECSNETDSLFKILQKFVSEEFSKRKYTETSF